MTSAKMIVPAAIVVAVMIFVAVILAGFAHVILGRTAIDYVMAATLVSLICLLCRIGKTTIQLARQGVASPLPVLWDEAISRLDRIMLSALIAPLFFAAFTTAKTCIPRLVGFHWDRTFTLWDAAIFGTDPWRLTHAVLSTYATWALAYFYTYIFGFALAFVPGFVAIFAGRRTVGVFFLALFLTWLIGGVLFAYALSSAGPVFAGMVDPSLQARFEPLIATLRSGMPGDWMIAPTQHYLASALDSPVVEKGGGISAMPSMHIASAMLYVMLARRTKGLWLALLFLALTWLGSVHFGYHYAIDGAVAIPIAVLCWLLAERLYSVRQGQRSPIEIPA